MRLGLGLLCVPVLAAPLAAETSKAKGQTDEEIQALAQKALGATDPTAQKEALALLKKHRFRSVRSAQREYVLYAQGMLEDRLGERAAAAASFKKLERGWPASDFLPEAQVILGEEALEKHRYKEAESRLRRTLMGAEIPVETRRRAQEGLLWALVEQGQPEKGLSIVDSLHPLGTGKPSERGLVAMAEVLAHAKRKDQAEAVLTDYRSLYPKARLAGRIELECARMLGALGETKTCAERMQLICREMPDTPEADEARLALATMITDGKLSAADGQTPPDPDKLLSEIGKGSHKEELARRTLLLKLRRAVGGAKWSDALDLADTLRGKGPTPEEKGHTDRLRAEAFRGLAQELLEKQQVDELLPRLDPEGLQSLDAEQRLVLAKRLTAAGLPSAALTVAQAAPPAEQPALRRLIAESNDAGLHPTEALALAPAKGESPKDALRRAQATLATRDFKTVRAALARALAGPERVTVLTAYLRRPLEAAESASARRQESEGWLARAAEKGPDREPLVILVADLRAKAADWRGALSLYPAQPTKANAGWVALMRATCQQKLGQKEAARNTLKQAVDEPGFKMERETLAKELNP